MECKLKTGRDKVSNEVHVASGDWVHEVVSKHNGTVAACVMKRYIHNVWVNNMFLFTK